MPPDTPARAEPKNPKPDLLSFDELPGWYQDNPHIRHGYRPISGSAAASIKSWRYLHNESVNIYSHLIPCAVFLIGEWYVLQYLHGHYADVTVADDLILAFFLLAAAGCLGLSAAYHTLINHSQAVERTWLRLDLVGIVLLTAGDLVSGVYMVFWCESLLQGIYWAMVSFFLPLVSVTRELVAGRGMTDDMPLSDPIPRGPDSRRRGPPPVPGSGLAGLQGRLFRGYGNVWSRAACSRVAPVRLASHDAPVRDALLPVRGRVVGPQRLSICGE